MNILNVNSYHYRRGGADNVYFQHAELMAELGGEVAFFSMHHPKNLPSPWSKYFVDEIEFGHDYPLGEKVVKASQVVWSFEAQRRLRRLLETFRPDVAHLHNIYHHLSPSILPVLRRAGVPTVMTAHDLKIACPNNKMYDGTGVCERCKGGRYHNVIGRRCVRGSLAASTVVATEAIVHRALDSYASNLARIVVPSRFFLEKFVEWGWKRDTFAYIPNWLDANAFEARPEPGDYFVYVGRLSHEKGIETLVRACGAAGIRLAIAGEGPLMPALRAMLGEDNTAIRLLGFTSGEALKSLVRGARAVVAPSECYENAPLSVLEAFAAGKPVVGSRIGGIPELIEEGRTGWLFEAGDVGGLRAALERVRDLPDASIASMGRAARALVERDFSRDRYVREMLELYASIGVQTPRAAGTVRAAGVARTARGPATGDVRRAAHSSH